MKTTLIREMPAADLIGRLVTNEHGAEFLIVGLHLSAQIGEIVIERSTRSTSTGTNWSVLPAA